MKQCDGKRPCVRCSSKGFECEYEVAEDSSRVSALKRANTQLREENAELKELYGFLRKRPKLEACEILNRVRASDDPIAVLHFIRQADLLLVGPTARTHGADLQIEKLDLDALHDSPIKVRARPWTTVAGDGLVSALISSFFSWDDPFFYPFVDREYFLRDMATQDLKEAKYCSPLLVNSICALRCVSSNREIASEWNLTHRPVYFRSRKDSRTNHGRGHGLAIL